MKISYVLPIKWDKNIDELTSYLEYIAPNVDLIIVDGSEPVNFEEHRLVWSALGKHIAPYTQFQFLNGKVNGVLTGLIASENAHIIIADDDVRYTLDQLHELDQLLLQSELIVPQNYFDPCPWHAQWDSSRSLLNLALAHDYPGTLAVQRDFILAVGGYDGNVLFENLELIRTVKAGNGKVLGKPELLIRRLPPSSKHFWSQRVRQAYDDYAQPARWLFFVAFIPTLIVLASFSLWLILVIVVAAIAIAEVGRQKFGGIKVFSISCSFFAPVWLLERGICTWLAIFNKFLKGGVRYSGSVISNAANPISKIRQRLKTIKPLTRTIT
ncbi:MAG: hypothetical protein WKF66_15025 [Pedobacter sp.]